MKIYIFTAVSLFLVTFLSCSSSVEKQNTLNQPPANTVTNISEKRNLPDPSKDSPPAKTFEEMEKINREAFNTKSNSKAQKTSVQNTVNSNTSLISRPAPDNSVISSKMDKDGRPVEVRSFNDNPLLIKVERIYVSAERKILKVYLKSGRIVELEEDRIPNFTIASVSAILTAAAAQN